MRLKLGVSLLGAKPELAIAITLANSIFGRVTQGIEPTITSVTDGQHKAGSLHYAGLAFDMRTHDLDAALTSALLHELIGALGPEFDVIVEDAGTDNEHIHIEYQPKG